MWDNSFAWNPQAFGGTEYMAKGWLERISDDMPKVKNYLALVAPGINPPIYDFFNSGKQILFWMHNDPSQYGADEQRFLSTPQFAEKLKYIIVPSEYAKARVIAKTTIPESKVYVIPNAIESLNFEPGKFNNPKKIKIINTSNAERGLDVLINAVGLLDPKEFDFELDVFSRFNPAEHQGFSPDPRINFYGFSYKPTVVKHYEAAHIHAYPSTYLETFCISQVEAMSAGLLCVTSDRGALPEVSSGFTNIYEYSNDPIEHAKVFAKHITSAIDTIKSGKWNPQEQIDYINNKYSWSAVKQQWLKLHELL